ncbi:membrane protein [Chania multitudinisentens RB-25]|uniref:Membrane protein n=1 Tax=Chania multitudinisentens RB-25 TaxID=1441930 RepID=W0L964_9GAMM|nr:OmpA family protein [Chania multitudinisentens]AHG18899.1 membrane protein [Chania multitudinisentens RB-25]
MKAVRNGFKYVNIAVLTLAAGLFSFTAFAESLYNNQQKESLSGAGVLSANASAANTYRPVAKVVPELAQIVFYYPQGNHPATINVDRELQSALLPGEFTVFCVAPGGHAIESYFQDQPLYQGKQNPAHQVQVNGSETYFLQVNPGTNGSTTALVERAQAEADLKSMRKQTRIINRASQVKACEYVNGGGAVLIQESIQFRFGKSSYDSILPSSVAKLDNVIAFITQGNNIANIQLVGYTDAIGNPESNQRLSQARANTIREALLNAGVSQAVITNVSGMGVAESAEGCVANASHQGAGCNVNSRRVDIIVR